MDAETWNKMTYVQKLRYMQEQLVSGGVLTAEDMVAHADAYFKLNPEK
jgi:hypothetical protein